jgi:hypothetical protein
MAESLRQE